MFVSCETNITITSLYDINQLPAVGNSNVEKPKKHKSDVAPYVVEWTVKGKS